MWSELLAEYRRKLEEMWKYKFNLLFANLNLFVIFYGLTKYLYEDKKEVMFLTLMIWYFSTHGLMNSSYELEDEILDRTIISIIQSKTSVLKVLAERSILLFLTDIIKAIPIFLLLYFFAGIDFSSVLKWYYIFIAIFFSILNSYLLGFIFSSFVFVFRRITDVISLLHYYILFFGGLTISFTDGILYWINRLVFPYHSSKTLIEIAFTNINGDYIILEMGLQAICFWLFARIFLLIGLNYSLKKGNLYGI